MKEKLNLLNRRHHWKYKKIALILMVSMFFMIQLPILKVEAAEKTFDFEVGEGKTVSGSRTVGDAAVPDKTVSQTLTGHTLVITQDEGSILYATSIDYFGDNRTALSGNAVMMDMTYDTATKLTLTVSGGYTFDLNALKGVNQAGGNISLKFTTIKGSVVKTLVDTDGNGSTMDMSVYPELKGVTSVEITRDDVGYFLLALDDVVLDNITAPLIPVAQVTGVSLSSSGQASWDNVTNESSYDVQLYKGGVAEGPVVNVGADTTSHNFLSAMRNAGAGEYTVKVTAKGDGTTYSDGPQSMASGSQTIIQLATVSAGLTWTGNVAHWTAVSNATNYDVQLYKDGSTVGSPVNVLSANVASGADFSALITSNGAGTYTYKVTAKGNGGLILNASISSASNNNIFVPSLEQVTGVDLSATGVASWNNVANESSYDVQLYKGGAVEGAVVNVAADTTSHNFLSAMRSAGNGAYTVKVTAKGNGTTYSNGPQSTASGSQTIETLSTVSAGLTWTGDVAYWTAVANATNYYVQLYKDGSTVGLPVNVLSANAASGADFTSTIASNGGGTYTYKVTAKSDSSSLYLDAPQSGASNDNINVIQLSQVTNVELSDLGVVSWDNVTNEYSYDVQLYKDGVEQGLVVNVAADTTNYNFLSTMRTAGAGEYTVKVTAKGNGTIYLDGDQSTASGSQTIIQLSAVSTGLTWTGNVAYWTAVANAIRYDVQLYKDGSTVDLPVNVLSANAASGVDFSAFIASNGVGTYTYKVTAKGNSTLILDASISVDSNNNVVVTPLSQVTGVSLSPTGEASWNNVANESSYDVQLYKDGVEEGSVVNVAADTTSYNFLSAMRSAGAGVYTVKVMAIGNGTTYSNGLQSTASGSETIGQLSTVSAGLTWTDDVAYWTAVANAVSYDVQLYKDGSTVGLPVNVLSANVASGADFTSIIASNGGGTYTYNVTAKSNSSSLYLDASQSSVSNNNIKEIHLPQVTNVVLSDLGVASWDNVSNESSYDVQLYKDGVEEGLVVNVTSDTTSYDFLLAMRTAGAGEYTVKVTAKGNGSTYSDGTQSDSSNARTIVQLSDVSTGLSWTGNVAHWTDVANAVSYDVQLYKSGSPVSSPINVLSANVANGVDFGATIVSNGIGTYTYKVTSKGDEVLLLNGNPSASSVELEITELDSTAPTVGDGGVLSASDLVSRSVNIIWTAATDNETTAEQLEYKLLKSTTDNINTVDLAEQNGMVVQDWSAGITSGQALNLTPNTSYYFNVIVKDETGNKNIYTSLLQTTPAENVDIPQHAVTFEVNGGSPVPTQMVNHGEKAIRPSNPVKSGYAFVDWYQETALANVVDFNASITTGSSFYAKWSGKSKSDTDQESNSPTNTGSNQTTPPNPSQNTAILINDQIFNIGKEESAKNSDGQSEAKITVDKQAILKQIDNKGSNENNIVQVNVGTKNADRAVVGLTGDIIKSLESNNFDLSVKKDNVQYQIPAKEFTIDKIAETLGVASNQLEKIEIFVLINEPSDDIQKSIEEQLANPSGVDFVVGAVDFELRAVAMDATGKTKEVVVDRFGQFVERVLEMPQGLDPNKITTGIVFNSDATFEHVPTVVYQEGNRWFAKISSRTNSTYSVVYHPLTVQSVENHWSKVAVNDMASRMVISETETFKPDEAITRGEFADYIVRALGLFRNECNVNNTFNDVSENDIHKISILLAKEYGIIAGYSDGSFKPNEKITREEAMAMFVNALELTELEVKPSVDLSRFIDADQISKWAKDDVEKSISTKIFNGRSKEKIEPKGTFTKAEAATAIRNLLIEAKLINEKM